MAWDFSTDPQFEEQLVWMRELRARGDLPPRDAATSPTTSSSRSSSPSRTRCKARGLWAAHLPAELGGMGFGQVQPGPHARDPRPVALRPGRLRQQRARLAATPSCWPPGMEMTGREDIRERWLASRCSTARSRSGFSMTEPETAGSDPRLLKTRATRDGDEWVINGHKWYTTNGSVADILIVMAVTNPDVHPYQGSSMFVVPVGTPGVTIVRDVGSMDDPEVTYGRFGNHAEIVYEDVRVPADHLIGPEGSGFLLAQTRLGPGAHPPLHALAGPVPAGLRHDVRARAQPLHPRVAARREADVQNWIADSAAEMHAARLMTLHAAWKMDQVGASASRDEIAMIKYYGATVLHNVIDRAIQTHGALGYSADMPLEAMYRWARAARIYDGPDEVHRQTVARHALKRYDAARGAQRVHPRARAGRAREVRRRARVPRGRPASSAGRGPRPRRADRRRRGRWRASGTSHAGVDVARDVLAARVVGAVDDQLVDHVRRG